MCQPTNPNTYFNLLRYSWLTRQLKNEALVISLKIGFVKTTIIWSGDMYLGMFVFEILTDQNIFHSVNWSFNRNSNFVNKKEYLKVFLYCF